MLNHEELIDLLKQNKNILAFGLEGSFGYGYQDKYSDVDLFAICKEGYSISKLIQNLKKKGFEIHPHPEILKNLSSFSLKTKDRRIDIKLIVRKNFDRVITEDLKIIFDPLNIFKKSKIKKPTKKDFEFSYRMIVYPLRIKKHYEICSARDNLLFFSDLANRSIEILIKLIYSLNKKEYICMKWAKNDLKKFKIKPKGFDNRINNLVLLGNKNKELRSKICEIDNLGDEIYRLILKQFPDIKKIKNHIDWMDK